MKQITMICTPNNALRLISSCTLPSSTVPHMEVGSKISLSGRSLQFTDQRGIALLHRFSGERVLSLLLCSVCLFILPETLHYSISDSSLERHSEHIKTQTG